MKKTFLSIVLSAFIYHTAISQNEFNCSSHEVYQRMLEADPQFRQNQMALEFETQNLEKSMALGKSANATYIIPVVFHVIYTTAYGNISDAQILDQIAILNKEFKRQQADTSLTPVAFKPFAAPFDVEFRLATIDPNGNCTNGINRLYSPLSNCSLYEDDVKSLSYWPSNKYLNIWITQSMHYSGQTGCAGGGYSTFPGGPATLDGINIRGDLISSIGTSATNTGWGNFLGRYLIHELGHWFNLRHIWGDAVCGNDQVADTPPAQTSNSGCPNFPRNPFNSCGGNGNGEMFTDYMDYTNGNCLNMFTAGQVTRMTAAITSTVSGRNNLWSNNNLNATGTANPYTYPVACASQPAVLQVPDIIACEGDSVKFTDNSYGGNVSSRLWDFGGQPSSSVSDSVVKVLYSTAGVYSFSLTNTYQSSSKSKAFTNKVYILPSSPDPNFFIPFIESFEYHGDYDKWTVVNHYDDNKSWFLDSLTAYTGTNCISVNNYGGSAPMVDEIISPVYDLSAVENPTLTFRLNFTLRNSNNNDQLQIFLSNNCGKTWTSAYLKAAPSLLNTSIAFQTASYIPSAGSDSDWRLEKVNLNPAIATGQLRLKFVFTSGGGNNLYIDDINIEGNNTTGLSKEESSGDLIVYPNPAGKTLNIRARRGTQGFENIVVSDLVGKTVFFAHTSANGQESIDISGLSAGVYFVSFNLNGKSYTRKFVKLGEHE